jgi:hypothetical protein
MSSEISGEIDAFIRAEGSDVQRGLLVPTVPSNPMGPNGLEVNGRHNHLNIFQ